MVASRSVLGPDAAKRWMPLAVVGLIAVTAGIALPQAMPTVQPAAAPASPAAKGKAATVPLTLPDAPDPKAMLTRLGLATAGVLGLCVGVLWLGRSWLGGAPPKPAGASQLCFIETLSLGNRCCIHLIHVTNRPVLIGADASGIKTVVPLPESFELALDKAGSPEEAGADAGVVYRRAAAAALDRSALTP